MAGANIFGAVRSQKINLSRFSRERLGNTEADLDKIRRETAREIQEATDGVYVTAVNSPFLDDLIQGRIEPFVAPVTVVTDHPEKRVSKSRSISLQAKLNSNV